MRLGIVGTGFWARAIHGQAALAHADVELVGVWGRDGGRASAAAQELGVPAATSFQQLVDSSDAVAFAVPAGVQAEMALEAVAAGRHVVLEKPVAFSSATARALAQRVGDSGCRAVVFNTHLWLPATADWLEHQRVQGGWDSGLVQMTSSVLTYDNDFSRSPWRHERGALWDLGPHALSLLIPVLGKVHEVVAMRGLGDTTHVSARHESGAVSSCLLALESRAADRYVLEFLGDELAAGDPFTVPTVQDCIVAYERLLDALVSPAEPAADVGLGGLDLSVHIVEVLEAAEAAIAGQTGIRVGTSAGKAPS